MNQYRNFEVFLVQWFGYLAIAVTLLFSQLIIINFLPPPGNFIQAIWVVVPSIVLLNRFRLALGLTAVFYLYLELLSGNPFGLLTTVGVVSLIMVERLYRTVLTNRSVYTVAALAVAGTVLSRFLSVVFLLIAGGVTGAQVSDQLLMLAGEIFLNMVLASMIFLFLSIYEKKN